MEHIVQFGITVDDEKIEKLLVENAERECRKQIEKATEIYTKGSYYGDSELKKMFREEVKKVVEDNKETILANIISEGAKNLSRTKAYKDACVKLVEQ